MAEPILSSIELTDFMCHSHLKIDFTKMITCIGGRNGSGKSAIMIALGILFGQSAKQLERGNTFKNLIKTGRNQAEIKVIINNVNNYKKSIYSSQIVIEKRLREHGSRLRVIGNKGKIINITRYDLEGIIDAYSLRFDNPLNFLTQEQSKKFLNISKPEALYEFYYQGTEFKNIHEELEECNYMIEDASEKLACTQQHLEAAESELVVQENKLHFLSQDHEQLLEDLEREEAWMHINEKLEGIKVLDNEIDELGKQIAAVEAEKNKLLNAPEITYNEISTVQISKELEELSLQYRGINNDFQEFVNEAKEKMAEVEKIKSKSKTSELEKTYSELNNKLLELKKRYAKLEESKGGIEDGYENEKLKNEENKKKEFSLRKQIEYLRTNANDPQTDTLQGQFAVISEEIKKYRFKGPVIGPVGNFISLKDHKWYKVASIVFKNSLNNYLVFERDDKNTLTKIFAKHKFNFTISQLSSNKPIKNYSKNSNYKSLLDVIELKNDIIINQLIIFHNAEQIILIDDRENAYNIIKSRPQSVESAYTPQGDRIKMVNNSLSDYRPKDDGRYWFEDRVSRIKGLERELGKITYENTFKDKLVNICSEIKNIKMEIENIEVQKREVEIELDSLKNFKENDTESLLRKISILENNIKNLDSKKSEIDQKILELKENKLKIEKMNEENKKNYNIEKLNRERLLSKLDSDVIMLESRKGTKILKKREMVHYVQEDIEQAGDEVLNPRSMEEIARQKRIIKEHIQRVKKMESRAEIEKLIKNLKKQIAMHSKIKNKFSVSLKKLKETYKKRIEKRDEIKDKKTLEAEELFRSYTRRNGYDGELVFDHENKVLDLRMRVHNAEVAGSKSTLSGGERSFAGVCFLLSLWKSFRCPLKILDEFDVFMDSVNRKVAINSLFEFFKENEMQVILITPLNTADLISPGCEIKVLNKADEES